MAFVNKVVGGDGDGGQQCCQCSATFNAYGPPAITAPPFLLSPFPLPRLPPLHRVVAEGIVDKAADLDVGTVMSMGFPQSLTPPLPSMPPSPSR